MKENIYGKWGITVDDMSDLNKIRYRLVKLKKFAYFLFHKSFYRVKEYQKENLGSTSCIIAATHSSDADGPLLFTAIDGLGIVAKKECFEDVTNATKVKNLKLAQALANLFGLGKWKDVLKAIDAIPVDRVDNPSSVFRYMVKYLDDADVKYKPTLSFVRGTLSNPNEDHPLSIRGGAFLLSAKMTRKLGTPIPIIPVRIEQPRMFRSVIIIYGTPYVPDVLDVNGKKDNEKLEAAQIEWLLKIYELERLAAKLANRPMRKVKLDKEHTINNTVEYDQMVELSGGDPIKKLRLHL